MKLTIRLVRHQSKTDFCFSCMESSSVHAPFMGNEIRISFNGAMRLKKKKKKNKSKLLLTV